MALTIGRAARAAGVNVETIRFYERRGLIEQPPKPNGWAYREYPSETVSRIRFIRKARALGFSLREISDLLTLASTATADCGDVRVRATAKIEDVSRKIAELTRVRTALETLVGACPGGGTPLNRCSVLDALADVPA